MIFSINARGKTKKKEKKDEKKPRVAGVFMPVHPVPPPPPPPRLQRTPPAVLFLSSYVHPAPHAVDTRDEIAAPAKR